MSSRAGLQLRRQLRWKGLRRRANLPRLESDPLDLPLQRDARCRFDPFTHGLAERLDVIGGGVAGVDQEVAMHLGNLRAADLEPAAARGIDEPPGGDRKSTRLN